MIDYIFSNLSLNNFFILFLYFLIFYFFFVLISNKLLLFDKLNFRNFNEDKTPLVGGLIIYVSVYLYYTLFNANLFNDYGLVFYFSFAMLITGAIDDSIDLPYRLRLILQLIVNCILIYFFDIRITHLGDLSFISFSEFNYFFSFFITLCSVIFLTNAFNFIDGIDGLCSGNLLISFSTILFIASYFQMIEVLIYYVPLIYALTIFLFFNLMPNFFIFRKIFLGDAGSNFLGFYLAWCIIIFSQNEIQIFPPIILISTIILPVFDMLRVIMVRILRKKSIFRPDRSHIHFLLMDYGLSKYQILIICLAYSLICNYLCFMVYLNFNINWFIYFYLFLFIKFNLLLWFLKFFLKRDTI